MANTILVVDDELEACLSLQELLRSRSYAVLYTTQPEETVPLLQSNTIDLVLLDIRMPKIGGIDLLQLLKRQFPTLPVIVVSGHATVDIAVKAMKYGAANLLTKPVEFEALINEIDNIIHSRQNSSPFPESDKIITQSPKMVKILDLVQKAAPTEATVLITGESGTGKELIANTIHQNSPRKDKQYIKVNCAAIPETLLESELFGHEKGAFTGADKQKKGYFETSHGGTLFLDEIGDMSLNTQAKMLRVLQEKEFTRVGGTAPLRTDCRIIAATNKNLQECIDSGEFREDLYYRLSVIHLELPPLRDRPEDIPLLADYFLDYYNSIYNRSIQSVEIGVRDLLRNHTWPGNIRELKNFFERSVIFCSGDAITLSIIPDQYKIYAPERGSAGETGPEDFAEQYKAKGKEIIVEALRKSKGVKQEAAKLLRIDRKTLYNRMKKFNIE